MKDSRRVLTEAPDLRILDLETAKVFASSTAEAEINDASINTSLSGLEWED